MTKENGTTIMSKTISQHVASLEDGYASLLLENKQLGEENQSLTKAVRELEDQQAITRQAYQNLLHEKDTTIAGLDATVAEKLAEIKACHETIRHSNETIKGLDAALAQARECNATLDHRLEQQGRRTATSVRIEGWDKQDNMVRANSSTCNCDHPGPFDSRNYCTKCGRKYNAPDPGLKFGEVQLAKRIYHNIHYPAIRALLGYESCRVLDIVLDLDQPGVSD
jgi:chromosome segregation ATPase